MERLTYYRLADSENMGYYLKPGVSVHEAIQRLGEVESAMNSLGFASTFELTKLAFMMQLVKIGCKDAEQPRIQFKNGSSLIIVDSTKNTMATEEESKGEQDQGRAHKWIGLDEFEQEWRIED